MWVESRPTSRTTVGTESMEDAWFRVRAEAAVLGKEGVADLEALYTMDEYGDEVYGRGEGKKGRRRGSGWGGLIHDGAKAALILLLIFLLFLFTLYAFLVPSDPPSPSSIALPSLSSSSSDSSLSSSFRVTLVSMAGRDRFPSTVTDSTAEALSSYCDRHSYQCILNMDAPPHSHTHALQSSALRSWAVQEGILSPGSSPPKSQPDVVTAPSWFVWIDPDSVLLDMDKGWDYILSAGSVPSSAGLVLARDARGPMTSVFGIRSDSPWTQSTLLPALFSEQEQGNESDGGGDGDGDSSPSLGALLRSPSSRPLWSDSIHIAWVSQILLSPYPKLGAEYGAVFDPTLSFLVHLGPACSQSASPATCSSEYHSIQSSIRD